MIAAEYEYTLRVADILRIDERSTAIEGIYGLRRPDRKWVRVYTILRMEPADVESIEGRATEHDRPVRRTLGVLRFAENLRNMAAIIKLVESEPVCRMSMEEIAHRVIEAADEYRRDLAAQNRRDEKVRISDLETAARKIRSAVGVILAHVGPEADAGSPTLARLADHLDSHLRHRNQLVATAARLMELRDATDRTLEDAARYKPKDVSDDPAAETIRAAVFRRRGDEAESASDQYLQDCAAIWLEATGQKCTLQKIGGNSKRKGQIADNAPRARYLQLDYGYSGMVVAANGRAMSAAAGLAAAHWREQRPDSNRREEHLATALFNASRAGKPFCLPDGQDLEIIDYQTPLKGKRENKGIGKIDLLGLIDRTLPTIIELKIGKRGGDLADTPLRALLEGLAYCAIFEANIVAIAAEALYKLSVRMSVTRPALLIMAPEDYWTAYIERKSAGKWLPEINALADELRVALDMRIDLVSLSDATFKMGLEGTPARLTGLCKIRPVDELVERSN